MKYLKVFLLVIVCLACIFLAVYLSGASIVPNLLGKNANSVAVASSTDQTLLDQSAPSFDLPNTSGGYVTLAQFLNTPTVLVFWSTWNKLALDQVKILDDYLASGSKDAGLVSFLAIDSQEDPSTVLSLIRRSGYQVPFALDTYGDTSDRYHIKSLPTTYFIDRQGVVREIYSGILSQSMLVDKMEQIIKQ